MSETAEQAAQVADAVVQFRSDMDVQLVRSQAADSDVLFAARVSTQGENSLDELEADPASAPG